MGAGEFFKNIYNKDKANVTNQSTNLWNNVKKDALEQWDRVTNQKVKTKKRREKKSPVYTATTKNPNFGLMDETTVTPEIASFDDMYKAKAKSEKWKAPTTGIDGKPFENPSSGELGGEEGYFSLFNAWSIVKWRGTMLESSNASLKDYNSPSYVAGQELNEILKRNPTATKIIEYTKEKKVSSYLYEYADFALCKYYGKIPNDYMITLRRFAMPIEDDIVNVHALDANGKPFNKATHDLARAITWMSEATGNKLEDILKFKVSTSWQKVESKMQEISSSGGGSGKLGSMIGSSPMMSAIFGAAQGKDAAQTAASGNGYDGFKGTYPNHIFGPINVIKEVMVREQGLNHTHDIELKFHYDLRQLKGVNPRVAFLDLMANLLVLTYNNGNFWGGSVRYAGGGGGIANRPFGDINKIKSGDFGGFLSDLVGSALKGLGNIVTDISQNGLLGSKLGNNLIGGKLMEMFNTPQGGEAVNAFLTGDATGQYHLTIGNPLNPIAVMGNLYCESADFQFSGELSYDGFPTELTLTVSLKPARPRDKADIESMFNGGRGRLYLTPEGGVDTNNSTNVSAYGNKDSKGDKQAQEALRRLTNG